MAFELNEVGTGLKSSDGKHKPLGKLQRQDFDKVHHRARAELPSPLTSSKPQKMEATRQIVQSFLDDLYTVGPNVFDAFNSKSLKGSGPVATVVSVDKDGTDILENRSEGSRSMDTSRGESSRNENAYADLESSWLEFKNCRSQTTS